MSIKDGGPAFPQPLSDAFSYEGQGGLTLRDYFAAQALGAAITAYIHGNGACLGMDHITRNVPVIAYKFADAMLAEREK